MRTGITSRYIMGESEAEKGGLAYLASQAAEAALESAGCDAEDIDLVLVATSTAQDLFGDATEVAFRIGAVNAAAFDLTAACTGFLFAVVTASHFLNSGMYRRALVVGADALSRWVDWEDRNTCILFGDGAGAMVLGAVEGGPDSCGLLGFALHSDGSGKQDLRLPFDGKPCHIQAPQRSLTLEKGGYSYVTMNGGEVYAFAVLRVPQVISEALDSAGLTVNEVDWLLLHQANHRITQEVAKKLQIPARKVIANVHKFGNTSAGSMPLALSEAVKDGRVKAGDVLACAGFGAGLSWGAAVLRWGGADAADVLQPRARAAAPPCPGRRTSQVSFQPQLAPLMRSEKRPRGPGRGTSAPPVR